MDTTMLTAGIVCVIASIVGGGLKAFGMEIPALRSLKRQLILGAVALLFLCKPVYDQLRSQPAHSASSSLLISEVTQATRGPVWDMASSETDEVVAKVTGEAHLPCNDCRSVAIVEFWRLGQGFETNWHIARRRDAGWYKVAEIDGPIAAAGNWEYLIGGIECPRDYNGEVSVVLAAFTNKYVQAQREEWLETTMATDFKSCPYRMHWR